MTDEVGLEARVLRLERALERAQVRPVAEDQANVAVELRELRLRVGMTQAQLASRAECSLSMIAVIEAGAVPRRSAVVGRLRAVLVAAHGS